MVLTVAAVLVVVVIALVLVLREQRSGGPGEPYAASSATGAARPAGTPAAGTPPAAAPAATAAQSTGGTDLDKAADAVGFTVTAGANVGLIENLPADTTLAAPSPTLLPVGSAAPDFTLLTPEGSSVRLSSYRGKTVLLEIFATWCPHCQAEAPHLLALFKSLPAGRFAFLSLNGDSEDAASVHAYDRYFGLPWPSLLDPGSPAGSFSQQGGIGPVSRAYGLSLFPTFYIIDARGKIAWRADREQPDSLLTKKLLDVAGS